MREVEISETQRAISEARESIFTSGKDRKQRRLEQREAAREERHARRRALKEQNRA